MNQNGQAPWGAPQQQQPAEQRAFPLGTTGQPPGGFPPPNGQPPPQQHQPPQGQPPPQQYQPPQGQPPPQQPPQGQPPPQQYQPPQGQQYQPPAGAQYQQPQGQQNYQADPFAGLTSGDQAASVRHPYLTPGAYKLTVKRVKFVPARSGKQLYIIESEIVESNNPQFPPGMMAASFIDMSNRDTCGKHVAAFVAAVYGFDPQTLPKDSPTAPWVDNVTQQQMPWSHYAQLSVSDANPFGEQPVGVFVQNVPTRAGHEFSLHTWLPIANMVVPPAEPVVYQAQPEQGAPPAPGQQPGQQWAQPQQQVPAPGQAPQGQQQWVQPAQGQPGQPAPAGGPPNQGAPWGQPT